MVGRPLPPPPGGRGSESEDSGPPPGKRAGMSIYYTRSTHLHAILLLVTVDILNEGIFLWYRQSTGYSSYS